ncbi:MAG: alpha-hydroxy acid oxidase [Bryobacteraceae bacterium]
MTHRESSWRHGPARRDALRALAAFIAGSPLAAFQQDPFRDHSRVPRLDELMTALDFESVAYAKLPRSVYDYMSYGTDSEFTLRRNREAFDWVKLVPGAIGGSQAPITATEILGTKMPAPIMISPTAGHQQLHPEGEVATYQGATAAGATPMIVSNVSSLPFEKIAPAAKGPLWFQLYPKDDPEANRDTLERVQGAGAKAIVVTIDQQASVYERALHDRNLGGVSPRLRQRRGAPRNPYRVDEGRLWYEWKLFDQIRPIVKVPIIAKGVLTPEDAKICLEHGVDSVYVSNHGGRSLDYGPSTLEVLPEIVDAVGSRVPILFDSGIRRGSDILKALALGARAVCLGRIPRWGLGSYGAPGVQRILEIMQAELKQAMAFTGRSTLQSIDRSLVRVNFP